MELIEEVNELVSHVPLHFRSSVNSLHLLGLLSGARYHYYQLSGGGEFLGEDAEPLV